jgi:23S rRNA (cytosine1962-C5)-methyltransferase
MADRRRLRLSLDKRTARAVAAGHPWIYGDVVVASGLRLRAGDVVDVYDSVGSFLGRGLADGPAVVSAGGPAVRMFSRDSRDPELRTLIFRRVAAARRLRDRVVAEGTTGFRLLHGEADGLPGLVVDRYGPVVVVRPDGDLWTRHLKVVVEALRSEGGAGIEHGVLRGRDGAPEVLFGQAPESLVIVEEGRRYRVRPGHGQKTGFFLDQRPNRSHVERLVRSGDRVLNLFSFTGGFSIAAARGGAAQVVSADRSSSILDDCRDQFSLNDLDAEPHTFVATDLFRGFGSEIAAHAPFDLVICDPPALARRKADLPRARAAYRRLHEQIAPLLAKEALLVTASCTARLTADDLLDDVRRGIEAGGRRITRELHRGGAGPDHPVLVGFPQGRYLSCLTLAIDQ